jgi:hypothetical protein
MCPCTALSPFPPLSLQKSCSMMPPNVSKAHAKLPWMPVVPFDYYNFCVIVHRRRRGLAVRVHLPSVRFVFFARPDLPSSSALALYRRAPTFQPWARSRVPRGRCRSICPVELGYAACGRWRSEEASRGMLYRRAGPSTGRVLMRPGRRDPKARLEWRR